MYDKVQKGKNLRLVAEVITTLGTIPCLVDEVTAHSEDHEWDDINDFNDIIEVVAFLGKETGEIIFS